MRFYSALTSSVFLFAAACSSAGVYAKEATPPGAAKEKYLLRYKFQMGEVLRYVLLYMPGAAGLLGAFVLLRRRNLERQSRQSKVTPSGTAS